MSKIRLGMLGPGRIVRRVMADWDNVKEVELTAIASRSPERAAAAAREYGARLAFGSYTEMAESDEIDLVYIATPHPMHADQACLMMEHGKHVLCEKPMTVNPSEAARMIDCAKKNHVFLMEAMWTRYLPVMEKLRELIAAGEIGEVRHINADFSFPGNYDPSDRAYAPAMAGGALLDLGVYPLTAITMILGWKPEKVTGYSCPTPEGVDMRMSGQLLYGSGATAQFTCGMDMVSPQKLTVYGTKGMLEIPGFWCGHRMTLTGADGASREFLYPEEHEGHHYEFDHAARCIREGKTESPLMTLEESLAIAELCTALRKENRIIYPTDPKDF